MQIQFTQAVSVQELEQILILQQHNLPGRLSDEERKKEGFVTVQHELALLEQMNDVCGHILAKEEASVVGYALCMHPLFCDEIPVLQPMFRELLPLIPAGYRYMVMGQVCVAKAYRGKGIFRGLYRFMSQKLQTEFDGIITEVDKENIRSLNAHRAVGFADIGTYSSGRQHWHILRLPL